MVGIKNLVLLIRLQVVLLLQLLKPVLLIQMLIRNGLILPLQQLLSMLAGLLVLELIVVLLYQLLPRLDILVAGILKKMVLVPNITLVLLLLHPLI